MIDPANGPARTRWLSWIGYFVTFAVSEVFKAGTFGDERRTNSCGRFEDCEVKQTSMTSRSRMISGPVACERFLDEKPDGVEKLDRMFTIAMGRSNTMYSQHLPGVKTFSRSVERIQERCRCSDTRHRLPQCGRMKGFSSLNTSLGFHILWQRRHNGIVHDPASIFSHSGTGQAY